MNWLLCSLRRLSGLFLALFLRSGSRSGDTTPEGSVSSGSLTRPNHDATVKMPEIPEIEPKKLTTPLKSREPRGRNGMGFLSELPTVPFDAIRSQAEEYSLDPFLVAAIVKCESAGDRYAIRYEKHYSYLFHVEQMAKAVGSTELTEEMAQKTSWGLMQIMGAVGRERGYRGWLPELTDMILNLKYGCAHLRGYFDRHRRVEDCVASYNAGSPRFLSDGQYVNQPYVDKVMKTYRRLLDDPNFKS